MAQAAHAARTDRGGSLLGRLTPAQGYCLAAGAVLLLIGILGFLADASFDTSGTTDADVRGNADGQLQGDGFLGFEVNGWHNVVHLLSGLVLLAAFRRRGPAKAVALGFGVVYGIVAIIGLIDGNDVLGIIPINAADSVLHIALAALGIVAALASRGDDRDDARRDERLRAEREVPAQHRTTTRR
jgi:hypothetical protein